MRRTIRANGSRTRRFRAASFDQNGIWSTIAAAGQARQSIV